jgi:hypothetical protein
MRRAIGFFLLLLAVGALGVVIGRSIAAPTRPPTRDQVLSDLGFERVVPDVNFRATPFDEAIDFLRQKTSANLVVRWSELEKAGIDSKTPITLRVANLPLRRVLELLCEEAGGGTVVIGTRAADGGTIVLSTAEDNTRYVETRLYDVRDLIAAHYDFRRRLGWEPQPGPPSSSNNGLAGGISGNGNNASLFSVSVSAAAVAAAAEPYNEAIDEITHMIMEFIDPDSWRDNGGTVGTVRDFDGRLMVTNTPDAHDRIAALLEKLRKGT